MKIEIFLDASVLFSAVYSPSGGSRELIRLAIQGEIEIVLSQDILDEVTRNLKSKAPDKVITFQRFIEIIEPILVEDPTRNEVEQAAKIVAPKDAVIIAAAKKSNAKYLVSLDKQHILNRPDIASFAEMPVGTPKDVLDYLRRKS